MGDSIRRIFEKQRSVVKRDTHSFYVAEDTGPYGKDSDPDECEQDANRGKPKSVSGGILL